MTKTRIGVLAAIGTEVLYGCSFAFTKNVTGTIDPFSLLGWRFFTASAALLVLGCVSPLARVTSTAWAGWLARRSAAPIVDQSGRARQRGQAPDPGQRSSERAGGYTLPALRVIRVRLTRATLAPLLVLAVFQPACYYIAETYGVMHTTASESGLLTAAIPVGILITSTLILRRRPTRWQVIGIAVTLLGVAVTVIAGGFSARFSPFGYLMLLGAVVSFSLFAAFADRFAAAASDIEKTFVMVVSGAVLFGTITVAQHAAGHTLGVLLTLPVTRPDFALAVAYLAIGSTIGAFFLQNLAIGAIGSTRFSTFIGITTLTTLITGAVFLRERLGWAQLLGGAVILAGVYVANRRGAVVVAGSPPE